jgi:O-antigen/teichoic acid export membrane protein
MTDAEPTDLPGQGELGAQVRRALGWSVANQVALRFATFASGIVLARLLTPDDFGVFAVALASMTILVALNDLGVILGIVRWKGHPTEMAKTAFTLAFGSSVVLFIGTVLLAGPVASVMGSPQADSVIRVMAIVVLIDGASAVSLGGIVRDLRQDLMARAEMAAIPVGVAVSVGLALANGGVWSLAIGRVAGALVTGILLVWYSPLKPRFGWDRKVARDLTAFGLPLAGTTLVEELLLNLDYFVVGAVLGVEALGFYLLAFNLSNWPISIMKEGIRRVSIAGFAKLEGERDRLYDQFRNAIGVLVTVALPIVLVLSILAEPLIRILYGEKWTPAATALGVLAFLGLARVTMGLIFDLLIALGRSRATLLTQLLWLVTLAPALYFVTEWTGTIRGPAVAHVVIAYGLILPVYLVVLHRLGVPLVPLARTVAAPLAAGAGLTGLLLLVRTAVEGPFVQLILGGLAVLAYGVVMTPLRQLRSWWRTRNRDVGETGAERSAPVPGTP